MIVAIVTIGGANETDPPQLFGHGIFNSIKKEYFFYYTSYGYDLIPKLEIMDIEKCIPHQRYPFQIPCDNLRLHGEIQS